MATQEQIRAVATSVDRMRSNTIMAEIYLNVNTDYLYKAIEQVFAQVNERMYEDMLALGVITYHPTTGYSTVEKPASALQQLATWLNTDEVTALDWLVYKVAAFRSMSEDEARNIITGSP